MGVCQASGALARQGSVVVGLPVSAVNLIYAPERAKDANFRSVAEGLGIAASAQLSLANKMLVRRSSKGTPRDQFDIDVF